VNAIDEMVANQHVIVTNNNAIMQGIIHISKESSDDDQSSSEDICKRCSIITWDVRDINRVITLYTQQYDEVRDMHVRKSCWQ
jgi:hypothetical protein